MWPQTHTLTLVASHDRTEKTSAESRAAKCCGRSWSWKRFPRPSVPSQLIGGVGLVRRGRAALAFLGSGVQFSGLNTGALLLVRWLLIIVCWHDSFCMDEVRLPASFKSFQRWVSSPVVQETTEQSPRYIVRQVYAWVAPVRCWAECCLKSLD